MPPAQPYSNSHRCRAHLRDHQGLDGPSARASTCPAPLAPAPAPSRTRPRACARAASPGTGPRARAKRLGGIAPQRDIPAFADQTFTSWFAARPTPTSRGPRGAVVLWPDSFTNYLAPQVGRAAVGVLEAAGYQVTLPDGPVCCGLTWISTGQLRAAKRRISRSLAVLAPQLDMGTPIVGLEPSCTAVLRRDASELLHDDARAAALATSTVTFAEFLPNGLATARPRGRGPGADASTSTPCSASTPTVR